jgi:hypothetical protein
LALVAAVRSELVLRVMVAVAVAAEGLVMPAIVSETTPAAVMAQVPPLSERVTVTVPVVLVAVAEQLLTPAPPIVTAGDAGTATPVPLAVTVIVSPARRTPPELVETALVVNPIVHVEVEPARAGEGVLVTLVTEVAAVWVKDEPVTVVRSVLVWTSVSVPAVADVGLVNPATAMLSVVPPAIVQVPPLSASVIVAALVAIAPVAEQLLSPEAALRVIAGVAGKVAELFGYVHLSVLPAWSTPFVLSVSVVVQTDLALNCDGERLTLGVPLTLVAAVIA